MEFQIGFGSTSSLFPSLSPAFHAAYTDPLETREMKMRSRNIIFILIPILQLIFTHCINDEPIDPCTQKPQITIENIIIKKRILAIIYDPIIETRNNKKLTEIYNWNDPNLLIQQYIQDVKESSWNIVEYSVVAKKEVGEFPQHIDGFQYTDSTYIHAWNIKKYHEAMGDYKKIITDFNIIKNVENDSIDEVWLFGAPGFGWWESTMAGTNAYWCNSSPVPNVECERLFVIMGFNYERGVDCMLENLGHRTESIMRHIYGSWNTNENHAWNKFTLYDKIAPGMAQCGNIHFAPNSQNDYDWGNTKFVDSFCDDWYSYPDLSGNKKKVNCQEWGNGNMRLHHIWWFKHIPRAVGITNGKLNNWWKYIMNYDEYN